MGRKFYRSRTNRVIWGVCGGLAEYFNIDPTLVRVLAVASLFVGSLGLWIYIIMALVVPVEPQSTTS
jgi:phage shock protein C